MTGLTRRRLLGLAAAGAAGAAAAPALARRPRARGGWLAGDLHSHTVLSHDVWGGPDDDNTGIEESYTLGFGAGEQIQNAELRGLDFLVITDHNRTDALRLPEYRSDRLTLLPAYEHSLGGGHAGVFMPDPALLADVVPPRPPERRSARRLRPSDQAAGAPLDARSAAPPVRLPLLAGRGAVAVSATHTTRHSMGAGPDAETSLPHRARNRLGRMTVTGQRRIVCHIAP